MSWRWQSDRARLGPNHAQHGRAITQRNSAGWSMAGNGKSPTDTPNLPFTGLATLLRSRSESHVASSENTHGCWARIDQPGCSSRARHGVGGGSQDAEKVRRAVSCPCLWPFKAANIPRPSSIWASSRSKVLPSPSQLGSQVEITSGDPHLSQKVTTDSPASGYPQIGTSGVARPFRGWHSPHIDCHRDGSDGWAARYRRTAHSRLTC
jgi:hypothetical protein